MDNPDAGWPGRADRHRHPSGGRDRYRAKHQYRDRTSQAGHGAGRSGRRQGPNAVLHPGTGSVRRKAGRRELMIRTEIRKGFYLDSVALMRAARSIAELPGIEDAGMMIGTPANMEILREAGLLDEAGAQAGPGDLVIALRARTPAAAAAAMTQARRLLEQPRRGEDGGTSWQPRTLRAAVRQMPDANLALISVPGNFAAAEARKALRRGLNVMIFSDNVPLAQEVALKCEARDRGLLVMGPDCGTAIVGGVPLAFANSVPRGDVGIIGASGTGIQEVSCLVANGGRGISHAIGTGGRDLSAEIGGISTLTAIDLLDNDAATQQVVLISKPPAPEVTKQV